MGNGEIKCFRSIFEYSININGCLLELKLIEVRDFKFV